MPDDSSIDIVKVKWLGSQPYRNGGSTFGIPWSQGRHCPEKAIFTCVREDGISLPMQTWNTAYWPDGSIKWTAHAISAEDVAWGEYFVHATNIPTTSQGPSPEAGGFPLAIASDRDSITVSTGKTEVSFAREGSSIIRSIIASNGNCVGRDGELVLLSQSSIPHDEVPRDDTKYHEFRGIVEKVVVEQPGSVRVVIAVKGRHHDRRDPKNHEPWLPFVLRFYLYANSDHIRVVHTFVYDGDPDHDFVRGIGIRFHVPLGSEPTFDRHVRFSGVDDGVLSESPQGLTGLWKDPGEHVRKAQIQGKAVPPKETWNADFRSRVQWIPEWNDYTLSQLSADGFNLRKRTKAGCSWVKIPSGGRAGGLVYLGGASKGGLAVGMRDFWERYPTQLDVRDAACETGRITAWIYSPSAEPMDLRQYHDGLQQSNFEDQLDAMSMTYEDWEPGFGTPYGVARTNELFIQATTRTPNAKSLASLAGYVRSPPVLVTESKIIYSTKVFGDYWCPSPESLLHSQAEDEVNQKLLFLFQFYKTQVSQRKWYGFWDYGDIMHTYDADRHTWRYDVGGYAWDNSELSPDLWLWLYFLRTGREDVYRMAEALTRHTEEVDVYHLGKYKGMGTRHGVQHWSDSCKQARISNALYRRIFYYLSGGDERTGDLIQETLDTEKTFLVLDPYRKVRKDQEAYKPSPESVTISLGTDWCALASSWFIEWERKGTRWEEAKTKLLASMKGVGLLTNGFVTGQASYNLHTGEISPPPKDPQNKGVVQVSHLSAMFGLFEMCAELLDVLRDEVPAGFKSAWLEYCRYFNASSQEQIERFGTSFGNLQLRQGHSRLTAYAAREFRDVALARRAWREFERGDGYGPEAPWKSEMVGGGQVLVPVEEAAWISTNITALYGLAAIQNLALIGTDVGGL